jgi:lysozyme
VTLKRAGSSILLVLVAVISAALLYWFGIWIPNNPPIATYPIRGIDVSHHQGNIHWPSAKAAGIRFAFIKATEGEDYKDPNFESNWTNSASAGLIRGAYHFFTLDTAGDRQALNFINIVPPEPLALPPAIDLEFSGYNLKRRPRPQEFARELSKFFDTVYAHYRKRPVIYTSYEFKHRYLQSLPIERLWIRDVLTRPRLDRSDWLFWQFSARARIPGLSNPVDLNVFNGSSEQLTALLDEQ